MLEAFSALSEALRHGKRNWQTWDNYTEVALRTGQFQQALHAMNQILQLTSTSSKARFDSNAVLALVRFLSREKSRSAETTEIPEKNEDSGAADVDFLDMDDLDLGGDDGEDEEAEGGAEQLSDGSIGDEHRIKMGTRDWDVLIVAIRGTLKAAAAAGIQGHDFWSAYSEFFLLVEDRTCYREALLKRLRSLQGDTWHETKEGFARFVEASAAVANAHLEDLSGDGSARSSLEGIRLHFVGALRQSAETELAEGRAGREELQSVLAKVEAAQKEF